MKKDRFGVWATTITVAVMFSLLLWISPLVQPLASAQKMASIGVGVLTSSGVYRLIASILYGLFQRSLFVRRLLLGRDFLEGTWVGFYEHQGQSRYTVEFFDQESGELKISGREFDGSGKTRIGWESSACNIDDACDRLIYSYSCDIYAVSTQHQGIGVFKLLRTHRRKAAHSIDGYSADLTDGKKDPNFERKISNERIPDIDALYKAKQLFQ